MGTLNVYKSAIPHINYIFKNGKLAVFTNGVFRTDIEGEIQELETEIKLGHPHIYVDAAEKIIDSEMVDPMNALRHKIIQEFLAKQAETAGNPDRDMGTTDKNVGVMPATSKTIAEAAAGGSGTPTGARIILSKQA